MRTPDELVILWWPRGHPVAIYGLLWKPVTEYWLQTDGGNPEYVRLERHRLTGALREARWQPHDD